MKTPYDTLQRLRRRELDELRLSMAAAESSADAARTRVATLERKIVEEGVVAQALAGIDFSNFAQRLKDETVQAEAERSGAEVRLEAARQLSLEAFVAKKAVDLAADGFVADQAKAGARAEQARLDEIALRRCIR